MSSRLAEAIRIGSKDTEQCQGVFIHKKVERVIRRPKTRNFLLAPEEEFPIDIVVYEYADQFKFSACALGAAVLAAKPELVHGDLSNGNVNEVLAEAFPEVKRLVRVLEQCSRICPAESPRTSLYALEWPLGVYIAHLNDAHGWTREQIADWVADLP